MSSDRQYFVASVFDDPNNTNEIVGQLIQHDFPMDRVSILQKAGSGVGDDFLGISYANEQERFKVWGMQGDLWGSLGGLLFGTAGLFLLPGIGPVLIAGPLIEALAGGVVGAGLMATGAAATHLTIALHRVGIPDDKLDVLHQAIVDGKTVVLLHCGNDDPETWRQRFIWDGGAPVLVMP
ncbi:hypothetical protein SAMN06265222_10746 [Neorhodopirellula lusitana]|uniref:DUF1269 domain-containing protein n=1 Tax=Neorhodopirellula lusitana TaxID=445327 RepID=A0ABY1Q694_9BACT|nr:hypothetical protein [Neorhodopirellula lusitana]SMP61097.1 hypothetical protein SAMN06265222_10746 [Neorhodopirellula lusitana]